ncbi:LytTR family DNA-binding domain-containing protein [Alteromonas facilis]|uniref:LytTR family DNA-binding domain-containing protein n=1 Tax=Alteromonas facilis TaxID=2048004 RepID=UPI000C28D98C|nr:LytTR family DNA-binding domain-containing protein [Alteromonas facilis]
MELFQSKQHRMMFLAGLVLVVVFQWIHFSVYFNQPVAISLLWSLVDWLCWSGLTLLLIQYMPEHHRRWIFFGFILFAGPAQIMVSSSIYQLLLEVDKTLWQSFIHLMNKRWLQNMLIAAAIASTVLYLRQLIAIKSAHADKIKKQPLLLNDGLHTYQIEDNEVLAVVAAKNYLSVYTMDKEIVIRETLKNMQTLLEQGEFVQVSRSAIVNKTQIKQIEKYSNASYRAVLPNQITVNIGRTYTKLVHDCLHTSP